MISLVGFSNSLSLQINLTRAKSQAVLVALGGRNPAQGGSKSSERNMRMFAPITRIGEVGMSIVVHGREISEYTKDAITYVMAHLGTEYSIRIWNRTSRNVEAVVTVDGLNITTGKVGDYVTQHGYLIRTHSHTDIPGFMIDNMSAARFTFSRPGASYAARMDTPNNIGIIGAAFFREYETPRPRVLRSAGLMMDRDVLGAETENCILGMTKGASRGPSAGTEFGSEVDFRTTEVDFRRANPTTPDAVIAVRYETREELQRLGIDLHPTATVVTSPNPFPANAGTGCPLPPGYHRKDR